MIGVTLLRLRLSIANMLIAVAQVIVPHDVKAEHVARRRLRGSRQ
jgi:hypothetical protein